MVSPKKTNKKTSTSAGALPQQQPSAQQCDSHLHRKSDAMLNCVNNDSRSSSGSGGVLSWIGNFGGNRQGESSTNENGKIRGRNASSNKRELHEKQESKGEDSRSEPSAGGDAAPDESQGLPNPRGGGSAELRRKKLSKDRSKLSQSTGGLNSSGKRKEKKQEHAVKAYLKSVFSYESGTPIRSRLVRWCLNLSIAAAIIGIFALKAAEEFYSKEQTHGLHREEHLATLLLRPDATEMDVRRAYRTLSVRWHPDKNPNCVGCQARFTEVATAYEYLMKYFRKQRGEAGAAVGGAGSSSSSEDAVAEDEAANRTESRGVIDLTHLSSSDVFYPTSDNNVWTLFLLDEDEYSEHVYGMWAETARSLGHVVKYGLIQTHKNKALLKKLPIRIKIFPAILVLARNMLPEIYPAVLRPSVESIRSFISKSYPNEVESISSAADLDSFLRNRGGPKDSTNAAAWLSQPYKVVLLPAVDSPAAAPPLAMKAAAVKYRNLFHFAYVQNVRLLLQKPLAEKTAFFQLLHQTPSSWLQQPLQSWEQEKNRQPRRSDNLEDVSLAAFTEAELKDTLIFTLFVDGGRNKVQKFVEKVKIPAGSRKDALRSAFAQIPKVLVSGFLPRIHPYLYEQNAALLCRGTLQQRVFTLVLVEQPPIAAAANTHNGEKQMHLETATTAPLYDGLTLDEIDRLVEASRRQFLAKHKDTENDHVEQRAAAAEEAAESEDERRIVHEDWSEDDLYSRDSKFHIQIARLPFAGPPLLPGLRGLSATSPFRTFWEKQLQRAGLFLLDLEGSRYALFPKSRLLAATANGAAAAAQKQGRQLLLSQLYQVVEQQLLHAEALYWGEEDVENDEEGFEPQDSSKNVSSDPNNVDSRTQLWWRPLPEPCDGKRFIRSCLPTAAAPWWWQFLVKVFSFQTLLILVVLLVGLALHHYNVGRIYEAAGSLLFFGICLHFLNIPGLLSMLSGSKNQEI